ncbi:MAG TPA: site-specific integrase, partial [Solirubrobacteraceae bacterium]
TAEGLSASTIHNTLDPLRVIYRRAIQREEGVTVDPTERLELRRPDGRRDRIATPDEAAALIAALPDSERALWACAFYAGLRRGELQALRWGDVDLAGRVIRVERGWDAIEGAQDAKSAAGKRRVPILDPLMGEMVTHKARSCREGEALVFGPTGVRPFSPETVRRQSLTAWGWKEVPNPEADRPKMVWIKARDDAARPITFHEARHTCASILIAAGVNAKALSVIMGHSTIAMTFDTYGHLMPGGLDEAAAVTNAYLAQVGERPALRLVG